MSYFTQDEISETWERLKNGDDLDGSRIVTNEELEQALSIVIPAPYNDNNDENAHLSYTRKRVSKDAPWGAWEVTT